MVLNSYFNFRCKEIIFFPFFVLFRNVAKRQSLNWGGKRILIKWYIHQNFVWWQRLKFDIVGRDEQVMLYSNIDRRNDDNDGDYYYCYCGYLAPQVYHKHRTCL